MDVSARADYENLIESRMREANLLLDNKEWDGAYYLAGYAVEFALKVRIIVQLMKSDGFPERRGTDVFYRHDLKALRALASLDDDMDRDPSMAGRWKTVSKWTEQCRYQHGKAEMDARELCEAIEKGVLPWIKARW